MQDGSARLESLLGGERRAEAPVGDPYGLERTPGCRMVASGHRGHFLADEAHALCREHRTIGVRGPRMLVAGPVAQIGGGDHGTDSVHG